MVYTKDITIFIKGKHFSIGDCRELQADNAKAFVGIFCFDILGQIAGKNENVVQIAGH